MSVRILVYTCDAYAWCLGPFMYLMDTYWSEQQPVLIGGTKPRFEADNLTWLDVESRIAARWSDGLIDCLRQMDDDVFVWMLEDYWLCRTVDNAAVDSLAEYMRYHPKVLKIDLTADRLYSGHAVDVDYWGHCDILETPWETPYQFSTQAAIWSKRLLLQTLREEMSPWDFELRSDWFEEMRVLGTRQWPVRYINGVGMGLDPSLRYRTEHVRDGMGGRIVERIDSEHIRQMRKLKVLP